jgi:hypothetical protein
VGSIVIVVVSLAPVIVLSRAIADSRLAGPRPSTPAS